MLPAHIGIVFKRFDVLAQNRLKMGAMRAEVAEEFQYFDFAGLLLRNRVGQDGVIDTFCQCGRGCRSGCATLGAVRRNTGFRLFAASGQCQQGQ